MKTGKGRRGPFHETTVFQIEEFGSGYAQIRNQDELSLDRPDLRPLLQCL